MRIDGKVWVVTGAGSGIGQELVWEIVRRGGRVAAVDLRQEGLDSTLAHLGAQAPVSLHVLDVADAAAVSRLPQEVLDAHGAVDGVINNAGIIQPFVPVAEMSEEDIQHVLAVNLTGTLGMVRAFLPLLAERPEAHLVNVSSMGGFFPFPGQTVYGASKAAVKLLSEGLYAELLDTPVRVTVVMPGAVSTNISANSGVSVPGGASEDGGGMRATAADAAARIILDGVQRDRLHVYVGRDARVMSLAIRLAPRRAIHVVQRQMKKFLEAEPEGAR